MSDNTEDILSFNKAAQPPVCRVAYTLNHHQPVICTYISDQPFFYLDYEDDIEEEDDETIFTALELGILDQEVKTLRDEIASFDTDSAQISAEAALREEEFYENMESLSYDYSLTDAQSQGRIQDILDILSLSRVAAAYVNIAEKNNVKFILSRQIETAFYDRRNGIISINPDMDIKDQTLLMSRELRRHWQHRNGVLINPLLFQPEHAILVNRAQEADLAVNTIRIAWELQLAGIKDVWERVENSPMGDLSRAYSREAFLDFRTINNGIASAAVFESWFLSERCRQQDKKVIQAMLADYKGYVFQNIKSSEAVSADLIANLGTMPFGKNYLSQHAVTIMNDPIFTEVRDRSNANFLWFIKFERSFKETEQELQSESDLSTHDVRHGLYNLESQERNNGKPQLADIIDFPGTPLRSGRASNGQTEKSGHKADVIDLARWSSQH